MRHRTPINLTLQTTRTVSHVRPRHPGIHKLQPVQILIQIDVRDAVLVLIHHRITTNVRQPHTLSRMRLHVTTHQVGNECMTASRAVENTATILRGIRGSHNHLPQHVVKHIRWLIHRKLGRVTEILRRLTLLRCKREKHRAHKGQQTQQRNHNHQRGTTTVRHLRSSEFNLGFHLLGLLQHRTGPPGSGANNQELCLLSQTTGTTPDRLHAGHYFLSVNGSTSVRLR